MDHLFVLLEGIVLFYLYYLLYSSAFRKNSSNTSLQRANSHDRVLPESSERLLLSSPEKPRPSSQVAPPVPTYRDRALSTIYQLRGHYQLSPGEIRTLSRNPELKLITIRAGNALLEAQHNLRNLKVSLLHLYIPSNHHVSDSCWTSSSS